MKKIHCFFGGHDWLRSSKGITLFFSTRMLKPVWVCGHCGHEEIA